MRLTPAVQLLGLGSYVAVCIAGGTIGGYFLDEALGTGRILTLGGLALGLVAAFYGGYRMLMDTIADIKRWEERAARKQRRSRLKNPKTLAIVVGALALLVVGFLFFRSPKPIIEIKAETHRRHRPLPARQHLRHVAHRRHRADRRRLPRDAEDQPDPHRSAERRRRRHGGALQHLHQTAGEKNGTPLLPRHHDYLHLHLDRQLDGAAAVLQRLRHVQKVNAHHFHEESLVFTERAGISLIMPNQKAIEFEVDETEVWPSQKEIVAAKLDGAPAGTIAELEHEQEETELNARERAIDAALPKAAGLELDHRRRARPGGSGEGSRAKTRSSSSTPTKPPRSSRPTASSSASSIPYFRSMNTDINSPLSIAIMADDLHRVLGHHGARRLQVRRQVLQPSRSPIGFFVGFLEFIAELARLISFTFRLFGNMLAGEILLLVMTFLMPFLVALPFYGARGVRRRDPGVRLLDAYARLRRARRQRRTTITTTSTTCTTSAARRAVAAAAH